MKQGHRWAIWSLLLAVSGLAAFGPNDRPHVVEPVWRPQEPRGTNMLKLDLVPTLHVLKTRQLSVESVGDPFATPSDFAPIYEEPEIPVQPQQVYMAPEPTAPPLPFRFAGMLEGAQGWLIQLERGGRDLVVGAGETIDGVYRVDGFENDQVALTYLPLSKQQYLPVPVEE